MLCDVHILTLRGREQWLAHGLTSLKDEPVTLHLLPGIPGHIGRGRAKGFSLGSSEYLMSVDDDDWVEPGVIAKLLTLLAAQGPEVCGVFAQDRVVDQRGRTLGVRTVPRRVDLERWEPGFARFPHRCVIYRRSAFDDECFRILNAHSNYAENRLNAYLGSKYRFAHLPEIGYHWRIHADNSYRKGLFNTGN